MPPGGGIILENPAGQERFFQASLSGEDFRRLSGFIQEAYGIHIPPAKKFLLETRLRKRLRHLGIPSFGEYCERVLNSVRGGEEAVHMIDAVSTNKTDFFREPDHFEYLTRSALPGLAQELGAGTKRKLLAWSAGCSSGEEPYTLAMVLHEFGEGCPGGRYYFEILATDISTQVLKAASRGVYPEERVEPVPLPLRKKYLLRSKDPEKRLVRVGPQLREKVQFGRLNLMEERYGLPEPMDFIFCRNVLIYFTRETQERVIERFYRQLSPGGYLFLGHTETLKGMGIPMTPMAPSVYRKGA